MQPESAPRRKGRAEGGDPPLPSLGQIGDDKIVTGTRSPALLEGGLVAPQVLDVAVVLLAVVFEEIGKAGGGLQGRERARVGPRFGVHLRVVDGEFVIDFGAAGD